jgi:hypothetical protein
MATYVTLFKLSKDFATSRIRSSEWKRPSKPDPKLGLN